MFALRIIEVKILEIITTKMLEIIPVKGLQIQLEEEINLTYI